VSGDALTRAVRNEPQLLALAITVALAAAVILAVLTLHNWPAKAGLLVILGAVISAVWLGALSVANREQPLVALSSSSENTGSRTLTVDVSAAGLRTTDEVLVQVIGLEIFTDVGTARTTCEHDWGKTPASGGTLLLWDRIGPDPKGNVKITIKIPVPNGKYQGICAWAPLPSRIGHESEARNSAAYLTVTASPA
jgi:hypothetical protein